MANDRNGQSLEVDDVVTVTGVVVAINPPTRDAPIARVSVELIAPDGCAYGETIDVDASQLAKKPYGSTSTNNPSVV